MYYSNKLGTLNVSYKAVNLEYSKTSKWEFLDPFSTMDSTRQYSFTWEDKLYKHFGAVIFHYLRTLFTMCI